MDTVNAAGNISVQYQSVECASRESYTYIHMYRQSLTMASIDAVNAAGNTRVHPARIPATGGSAQGCAAGGGGRWGGRGRQRVGGCGSGG